MSKYEKKSVTLPIYNGRLLNSSSTYERNLQIDILNRDYTTLLEHLADTSLFDCGQDTIELIKDTLNKIPNPVGRPPISPTKKALKIYKLVFAYIEAINVLGNDHMKAVDAVLKTHGGSISEVEKALTSQGVGVKNARKKD